MIKTEELTIRGRQFVRTYSDAGMLIHGGMPEGDYEDAIDPAELGRIYVETDIPIEGETEAEELLAILTGDAK